MKSIYANPTHLESESYFFSLSVSLSLSLSPFLLRLLLYQLFFLHFSLSIMPPPYGCALKRLARLSLCKLNVTPTAQVTGNLPCNFKCQGDERAK